MSETIQDLYTSFSEQMEPIQEDSRYFRYLFEMAQASGTTIEQQREELVKVVDEEWISMIEDSLDAINTIIEKPRRFITTEEEVVPVSLAIKTSMLSTSFSAKLWRFLTVISTLYSISSYASSILLCILKRLRISLPVDQKITSVRLSTNVSRR